MNTLFLRRFQHVLRSLGPLGVAGLLLLLLSALLWLLWVSPAETDLEGMTRKLQDKQSQLTAQRRGGNVAELSREEQLDNFYKSFPDMQRMPDLLQAIYQAAQAHQLSLETSEYALTKTDSDRLARYRMAVPVKGNFSQVLGFMNTVLHDLSNVALEGASFKREKVDDTQVEAKLVFMVYIEGAP